MLARSSPRSICRLFVAADARDEGEEMETASLPVMPLSEHVVSDYQTVRLSLKAHPMHFLRDHYADKGFITADRLKTARDGKRVQLAGVVLTRQRPGSAKGVCFITLEDETGVANLIVWPDVFDKQRKIVMGARLLVVHGIVQRDSESDVIHVVVRKLEDGTPMLRQLSDGVMPSTLNQGDAGGSWRRAGRAPPARCPGHPEKSGFSLAADFSYNGMPRRETGMRVMAAITCSSCPARLAAADIEGPLAKPGRQQHHRDRPVRQRFVRDCRLGQRPSQKGCRQDDRRSWSERNC